MYKKITILNLSVVTYCFSLTNELNNDELLKKNGEHFQCLFPKWIGTLIHPQWCITTAHAHPTISSHFKINNEDFYVEKVIIHPLYPKTYNFKDNKTVDLFPYIDSKYDMALVKINKPILKRPFVQRERNNISHSSRNWIASIKDEIPKAGLVQLCNLNKEVFYKSWTQKKVQPLISNNVYLCFYNSQKNFGQEQYTFNPQYNRIIKLSNLNPKLEESELAVMIEGGDSGSPTFSYSSSYGISLPPLSEVNLTGITVGRLRPPTDSETKGHMGIILRLANTGINEFIDHTILLDALNMAMAPSLTQKSIEDQLPTKTKIAYSLPSTCLNKDWIVTPQALSHPLFLGKYLSRFNSETKKIEFSFYSADIKKSIDKRSLRFIQFSPQIAQTSMLSQFLEESPKEEIPWNVYYPASRIKDLPTDFEYSSIQNQLLNLLQEENLQDKIINDLMAE